MVGLRCGKEEVRYERIVTANSPSLDRDHPTGDFYPLEMFPWKSHLTSLPGKVIVPVVDKIRISIDIVADENIVICFNKSGVLSATTSGAFGIV